MNSIKKFLLSLLGEKKYLDLLASTFQKIFKAGLAGIDYQDIYFLRSFIQEGNYCVDIGAHLGYYTLELSRLVKSPGKVYAVEPMSKFHNTLQKLLRKKNISNVTLYQTALGGEGEYVDMGIPKVGPMKKFAYARVIQSHVNLEYVESEKVKNSSGDELFKQLPRLDFIKCDVEGLEVSVFSSMMGTLSMHHPVLLCELADKNERIKLYEMIAAHGYRCYLLRNKKLHLLDVYSDEKAVSHNHYFIPEKREGKMRHLIS
ncbi:MAG TPA: FkbM family methyltransferase [Puia sp.]|nr:FkbM family methyltransferase [Puia sp.]